MTNNIILHEVGLRDGLQMEKKLVPTETKIEWIEKLIAAGMDVVQCASFVNPKKAPQMADADEIFKYFSENMEKKGDAVLSGLVLNEKGLDRALKAGVDMICVGVSASDTHSRKNVGIGSAEALERIIKIAREAKYAGKRVQASVQSAFGCGFEGEISMDIVVQYVIKYLEAGIYNISLADTAGHANPAQVEGLFRVLRNLGGKIEIACHFHNTYAMGIANCYAALKNGAKYIETALAGLGGCPFTKLPAGNVCTEDLIHMLQRMNIREDVNLLELIDLAKSLEDFFEKPLPGYVYKSGPIFY